MTKFLNISTDNTLGGNSPSDETVSSQKAVRSYVNGYALNNKATGSHSLTLLGNATSNTNAVNIGYLSTVAANGVSIGSQATTTETNSIAIGYSAIVTADYAIQLGVGTNAESGSLYVGTSNSNNYKLLGSDGKIPSDRIPDLSSTYQATLVSGTNIKTINNTSLLGSGNITVDSLPSQTGQSGKFLTTNGTSASWANVSGGGATLTYDSTTETLTIT